MISNIMEYDILRRLKDLSKIYIKNRLIRRPTFLKLLSIFIVAFALTLGYNLLIEIGKAYGYLPQASINDKLYSMDRIKLIVNALIIAPIAEELVFRGGFYMILRHFISEKMAWIISAISFAVYHMDISQSLYAFLFGLALVSIIRDYGDLFSSVFMHFCANLIAIVLTDKGIFIGIMQNTNQAIMIMIIAIAAGNILLLIMRLRLYVRSVS